MPYFKNIFFIAFILGFQFICFSAFAAFTGDLILKNTSFKALSFKARSFQVGRGASSIAVFDFNHDGHQDIVVANSREDNIYILAGDGIGSFSRFAVSPAGEKPADIFAVDLNNDGFSDLIIANHETDYITLLLGDGAGRFDPAPHSPLKTSVRPHPHVVQAADLNNDGFIDIIIDDRGHNGLLVLKGTTNGQFEKNTALIEVAGDPYLGFASADLNNDGFIDFVTPNTSEVVVILNQKSTDFTFKKSQSIAHASPFAVALADLNDDGFIDLIVASVTGGLAIMSGNGKGQFSVQDRITIPMQSGAKQIATGDINGDGISDLLVSNWNHGLHVILGGKSDFKAQKFKPQDIENPWGIHIADLNKDGKGDLIITDGMSTEGVIYLSVKPD